MSTKVVWGFVVISLLLISAAFATNALDSVFTIVPDKKSYQMGEEIWCNWYIRNTTKESLTVGNPNDITYRPVMRSKLIKTQGYGRPLFDSGEPLPLSGKEVQILESSGYKKFTVPPGYENWGRLAVAIPMGWYNHGLNPGTYSLQEIVQGGPLGVLWSNVVEFEVLEPRGEEGKAWTLLSEEIGKIENRVDSLERVKEKAVLSMFRSALREEIWDLKEGPYRQVVQRYPNTNCAQVAVKHLDRIYSDKFSHYTQLLYYYDAEEEVKRVIPDSLKRKYQLEVENRKEDYIKREGKAGFNGVMRQNKDERAIIDAFRNGLRESHK